MPPMLDCDAVMRQLWDYLDEELTPTRMAAIREHLAICQCCQPHADFAGAFLDALARVRNTPPASGKLRIRVLSALRAEGFAAITS